jgi:hypothetical protein
MLEQRSKELLQRQSQVEERLKMVENKKKEIFMERAEESKLKKEVIAMA